MDYGLEFPFFQMEMKKTEAEYRLGEERKD